MDPVNPVERVDLEGYADDGGGGKVEEEVDPGAAKRRSLGRSHC